MAVIRPKVSRYRCDAREEAESSAFSRQPFFFRHTLCSQNKPEGAGGIIKLFCDIIASPNPPTLPELCLPVRFSGQMQRRKSTQVPPFRQTKRSLSHTFADGERSSITN